MITVDELLKVADDYMDMPNPWTPEDFYAGVDCIINYLVERGIIDGNQQTEEI